MQVWLCGRALHTIQREHPMPPADSNQHYKQGQEVTDFIASVRKHLLDPLQCSGEWGESHELDRQTPPSPGHG